MRTNVRVLKLSWLGEDPLLFGKAWLDRAMLVLGRVFWFLYFPGLWAAEKVLSSQMKLTWSIKHIKSLLKWEYWCSSPSHHQMTPTASCFEKGFGGILSPVYQYIHVKKNGIIFLLHKWNLKWGGILTKRYAAANVEDALHSAGVSMRFNVRKIMTGHPQMARAPFATQAPSTPTTHQHHPGVIKLLCKQPIIAQ